MPVCFKPGKGLPHILAGDRSDPNPPRFLMRALSGAEAQDVTDLLSQHSQSAKEKSLSGREGIASFYDIIRNGVNGKPLMLAWENFRDPANDQEIAFDLSKLEKYFSIGEARELISVAIAGISEDDRKK
jgi:hypothetical protein